MKKNLFYLITAIGILSIAASLFVTLNLSSKNHITGGYYFSENVEALASGEADLEVNCFYSPGSECLINAYYGDGSYHKFRLPDAINVYYVR